MFRNFEDWMSDFHCPGNCGKSCIECAWEVSRRYPEDKIERAINVIADSKASEISKLVTVLEILGE